jgi:O-antigen ligase
MVMALPIALALGADAPTPTARRGWRLAAITVVAGSLTTLSRGGTLALLVTTLAVAILPARALFRSSVEKLNVSVITGIVLVAAVLAVGPHLAARFDDRPTGGSALGTRGHLWSAAAKAWSEQPATGIGYGSFQSMSYDLLSQTPGVELELHLPEALEEGRVVHNVYLEALAELGPTGLAVLSGTLVIGVVSATRRSRAAARTGALGLSRPLAGLAAALVGFAGASLFLSTSTSRVLALVVGLLGSSAVVGRSATPDASTTASEAP